jgi:CheY-like chemotaxis protein
MATILLVDDVELFLQLEESFLEDCGHQLVTATSGEEALERMQSINPDLLLLDLYLPGIDGDEVCRRLRSSETWDNLPIVMVTAAGKETEIHKCLAAGCDDYLTKPINKKDLLDKVQRLLGWAVPRSAPRVSAPLRVQLTNSGRSLSTNARDISRTGIYVRSPHPLQVESLVELLVEFSATEQVSLAGMVKRVEQGAEPGMGIYFVHPDPKGQAALDRYVRSQAGEPQASAQQAVTQKAAWAASIRIPARSRNGRPPADRSRTPMLSRWWTASSGTTNRVGDRIPWFALTRRRRHSRVGPSPPGTSTPAS